MEQLANDRRRCSSCTVRSDVEARAGPRNPHFISSCIKTNKLLKAPIKRTTAQTTLTKQQQLLLLFFWPLSTVGVYTPLFTRKPSSSTTPSFFFALLLISFFFHKGNLPFLFLFPPGPGRVGLARVRRGRSPSFSSPFHAVVVVEVPTTPCGACLLPRLLLFLSLSLSPRPLSFSSAAGSLPLKFGMGAAADPVALYSTAVCVRTEKTIDK